MKVLQINPVYGEGSTGKIALAIHDVCAEQRIECRTAYGFTKKDVTPLEDTIAVSSRWDTRLHGWWSRFTMFKGTGSCLKTVLFLKKMKQFAPNVIHLHNLHGSYINLPLLFRYIKKHRIPVVWTLHDCWAFTAICSHFAMVGCERWQSGCGRCPQKDRFSSAPIDLTRIIWSRKRAWFTGVPAMTIVTPSIWLEELVRKSFLQEYSVKTIHNGVDLQVFQPTESDFCERYGLREKRIVLGVAFDWGYGKGLDVFLELAKRLDKTYQIVLVGTNAQVDRLLPDNILSIHRTNNQQELAGIYTAADVFVNPTREEVLGLVNIEALACGTPVITFRTGGSPECVTPDCGIVIDQEDLVTLEQEVVRVCKEKPYSNAVCRESAMRFEKKNQIEKYIELYKNIVYGACFCDGTANKL